MDGPEIVKFTLEVVPAMIERVLDQSKWTRDDVEFYLVHQATLFMLEHLRVRLDLAEEQMPLALQEYGNTVSSTLPLLMHDLRPPAACGPARKPSWSASASGYPGPVAVGPKPGSRGTVLQRPPPSGRAASSSVRKPTETASSKPGPTASMRRTRSKRRRRLDTHFGSPENGHGRKPAGRPVGPRADDADHRCRPDDGPAVFLAIVCLSGVGQHARLSDAMPLLTCIGLGLAATSIATRWFVLQVMTADARRAILRGMSDAVARELPRSCRNMPQGNSLPFIRPA